MSRLSSFTAQSARRTRQRLWTLGLAAALALVTLLAWQPAQAQARGAAVEQPGVSVSR